MNDEMIFFGGEITNHRTLRIADGPDEVHLDAIAKLEYEKQKNRRSLFSAKL
jgi:hypothetical protein